MINKIADMRRTTVKFHNKVEDAPGQGTLAILTFARGSDSMPARSYFECIMVPWRSWGLGVFC